MLAIYQAVSGNLVANVKTVKIFGTFQIPNFITMNIGI